jgi:hypothetical protein
MRNHSVHATEMWSVITTWLLLITLSEISSVKGDITRYTLGIITATNGNRTTDLGNLRYTIHAFQAIDDLLNGNLTLSPPLPNNVTISLVHRSSYLTPTGAFIAGNSLITVSSICILHYCYFGMVI